MNKKEKLQNNIDALKSFAILLLTSLFGVLGYGVANLHKLTATQFILGGVLSVGLCLSFAFCLIKFAQQK